METIKDLNEYTYYWEKDGNVYALRHEENRHKQYRQEDKAIFDSLDIIIYATTEEEMIKVESMLDGKVRPYNGE